MKMILRIFSNTFLIAVILVIVLGYVYRTDLFPGLFNSDSDYQTVATSEVSKTSEASKNSGKKIPSKKTEPAIPNTPVAISNEKKDSHLKQEVSQPGITSKPNELPTYQTPTLDIIPGTRNRQVMNPYGKPAQQLNQPGTNIRPETNPEQEKVVKMFQLVSGARQAFWLKKYDEAEKQYKALIGLEPGNPDLTGELGNFYYNQGKWNEAADNYYKCAISLLELKRYGQAVYISKIVRGLNKDLADKLDKKFQEIRKPG